MIDIFEDMLKERELKFSNRKDYLINMMNEQDEVLDELYSFISEARKSLTCVRDIYLHRPCISKGELLDAKLIIQTNITTGSQFETYVIEVCGKSSYNKTEGAYTFRGTHFHGLKGIISRLLDVEFEYKSLNFNVK